MTSRKPLRSNVSASSGELLMTSSAWSTLTFVMLCTIWTKSEIMHHRWCAALCVQIGPSHGKGLEALTHCHPRPASQCKVRLG